MFATGRVWRAMFEEFEIFLNIGVRHNAQDIKLNRLDIVRTDKTSLPGKCQIGKMTQEFVGVPLQL